jgi:hypothetical protein
VEATIVHMVAHKNHRDGERVRELQTSQWIWRYGNGASNALCDLLERVPDGPFRGVLRKMNKGCPVDDKNLADQKLGDLPECGKMQGMWKGSRRHWNKSGSKWSR